MKYTLLKQDCSDEKLYYQWQEEQCVAWEALCTCCGACCGIVEGDPCEHLMEFDSGKYACRIYQSRFGLHKTISGRPFHCIPIRDILDKSWPGNQQCAYKTNRNST